MGASLLLVVTVGCVGTTNAAHQPAEFVDPVLGILNDDIIHFDVSSDRATKRLEELEQFPDTQDTMLQAFRAMDLIHSQLRQQQLVLQLNHLHFVKAQMIASNRNPDDKSRLLQKWTIHEREYRKNLDTFWQKRLDLEHKRLMVEARLIERSLK